MKSFKEFSQDEKLVEQYNTEALNFLQRLQKSRIMKRIKHKIQRGAKLARRRIVSDPDKLMKRAIKQQRMKTAKKLLKGVSLASVSDAEILGRIGFEELGLYEHLKGKLKLFSNASGRSLKRSIISSDDLK